MNIKEEEIPNTMHLSPDFETFLEQNMSVRNKKVISILASLEDEHIVNLYKTALYCFFHKDIPFQQMLFAHSIRELVNVITRKDNLKLKQNIVEQILQLQVISFLNVKEDTVKSIVTDSFLSQCHKERYKICLFIKDIRADLEPRQIEQITDKLLSAKEDLESLRHVNGKPKFFSEAEMENYLKEIEEVFLILNVPFFELKKEIDSSLSDTPAMQVKVLKKVYPKELSFYFFKKLKKIESFAQLSSNNFLKPVSDEKDGKVVYRWPALTYLINVSKQKEKEIVNLINSLPFSDYQVIDYTILDGILQLALKFKKKEHLLRVCNKLTDLLNNNVEFPSYFDAITFLSFIKKIKNLGYSKEAFNLLKALSTLKLIPEKNFTSEQIIYRPVPRFSNSDKIMGNYFYHKLVNQSMLLIKKQQDAICLLKIYYEILDDLSKANTLTKEEQKELNSHICFDRAAIEDNQQNMRMDEPISDIINMIRDISVNILQHHFPKNREAVLKLLKRGKGDIFKRILLYLASRFPEELKEYITNTLPKRNYFMETDLSVNVHHEYYILLRQEFKKLPKEKQNIILNYIKDGPQKNNYTAENIERWRFKKLYPIHEYLPKALKKYYRILERRFGNEIDHPDFLYYISSSFSNPTPKTEEELSEMSVEQIIAFLKEWQPENNYLYSANRSGLSDTLVKDIQKRPKEYIKCLNAFKEINEPTYIHSLLNTLLNANIASEDFVKICDFIEWTLTKKNEHFPDRKDIFDGLKDWTLVYRTSMNILTKYFNTLKGTENLSPEELETIKKAYSIIQQIILMKDNNLKKSIKNNLTAEYYQNAINSLHGEAMDALFQYGIWQKRSRRNLNNVPTLLEKVLKENLYPETYAVIGRYLPWIKSMDENWFMSNLNKLLPEDNDQIFDIVWTCYVNFVKAFNEMYIILRDKLIYALNRDYPKKEDRTSTVGHLAMYYGRGLIAHDDKIFKFLFSPEQDTNQGVDLLDYIGRSLQNENNKTLKPIYYERFKKLWTEYRNLIKGNEKNHREGLQKFSLWYVSGVFEQKWALDQLYDIVCNQNVIPNVFYDLIDKLTADIDCNPLQCIQIVEKMLILSDNFPINMLLNDLVPFFIKTKKNQDDDIITKANGLIKAIINKYEEIQVVSTLEPLLSI